MSCDYCRRSALHCAAYVGSVECCTVLAEGGADINQADEDGLTPLHWACSAGHSECVVYLLDVGGAYPNPMDTTDQRLTPLDYAILGDYQDLSQLLIERGALTITSIQDLAATVVQRIARGFLGRRRAGRLRRERGVATTVTLSEPVVMDTVATPPSEGSSQVSSTAVRRRWAGNDCVGGNECRHVTNM